MCFTQKKMEKLKKIVPNCYRFRYPFGEVFLIFYLFPLKMSSSSSSSMLREVAEGDEAAFLHLAEKFVYALQQAWRSKGETLESRPLVDTCLRLEELIYRQALDQAGLPDTALVWSSSHAIAAYQEGCAQVLSGLNDGNPNTNWPRVFDQNVHTPETLMKVIVTGKGGGRRKSSTAGGGGGKKKATNKPASSGDQLAPEDGGFTTIVRAIEPKKVKAGFGKKKVVQIKAPEAEIAPVLLPLPEVGAEDEELFHFDAADEDFGDYGDYGDDNMEF
jgi:hypothetical protein